MKKLFVITLLLSLSLLMAQEANLLQQVDSMLVKSRYQDQEIIVQFKSETISAKSFGIMSMKNLGSKNLYCAKIQGNMKDTLVNLLKNSNVAYAEPNYIVKLLKEPNDPKYSQLWGMAKIQGPKAWDLASKAPRVVVAVIDTGVDYNHEDLKANMWVNQKEKNGTPGVDDDGNGYVDDVYGWNGAADNGDPLDDHNHGTHCAGTVAGVGNNGVGVAGVCWNAQIMAGKFLTAEGSGTTADAIECINYAVANGAKVLSNSWGGGDFSEALYNSIKAAGAKGVLFVAAAGNSYSSSLSFPAAYCEDNNANGKSYPRLANVLSVAASTQNDSKASFSQYSKKANSQGNMIAAPGYEILSTVRGNSYDTYSGTSMATPHVAGAATLLIGSKSSLTASDVKKTLVSSGDKVTWSIWWDKLEVRRLNIYNALKATLAKE